MANSEHLIRSGDHKNGFTAYCGHKQVTDYNLTRYAESHRLCSKCSSKYYAEQIKTSAYRLGERLDLSNDNRRYRYKSIYEIIRNEDNAVLGFVVIKNGWGNAWEVHNWEDTNTFHDAKDGALVLPRMSGKPLSYRRRPDDIGEYGGTFASKEAALFAVPVIVEQGKLPSYDEKLDVVTKHFNTLRQSIVDGEAERQRARADREARLEQIREQFTGLVTSVALTNAQRTAVIEAANLLGLKLQ